MDHSSVEDRKEYCAYHRQEEDHSSLLESAVEAITWSVYRRGGDSCRSHGGVQRNIHMVDGHVFGLFCLFFGL
jgi:hypothetical protein